MVPPSFIIVHGCLKSVLIWGQQGKTIDRLLGKMGIPLLQQFFFLSINNLGHTFKTVEPLTREKPRMKLGTS